MSLYYEAASFLSQPSVKLRIFNSGALKSSPKLIYSLVTDASKWSLVLKEVIENSELLAYEHKVRFLLPAAGAGKWLIANIKVLQISSLLILLSYWFMIFFSANGA